MITPSYSLTATERVLPRLALDFTTASLDSRITFTRAGNTATVVNSSGVIETVNADLPRFDYDPVTLACKGLLIEEARTNRFINSAAMQSVPWNRTNMDISGNNLLSPDGTTTAALLSEQAVLGTHVISQDVSFTSGIAYTTSLYVKKGPGATAPDWIQFTYAGALFGTTQYANFNISLGTVGANASGTASITNAGNGWFRISFTATATSTGTGTANFVFTNNNDALGRAPQYTGATTSNMYIWGAQLEAGAFATSYIPTTTTALTRNADVATMTGTNFSDWYNATEGTFVASGSILSSSANATLLQIDDNTASNRFICICRASGVNDTFAIISASGVQQLGFSRTASATNTISLAYKVNNCVAALNGNTVNTDTSVTIPSVDRMRFGASTTGTFSGYVQSVNYYPQRLTNSETQAFSK
jgi:hypothetical protein